MRTGVSLTSPLVRKFAGVYLILRHLVLRTLKQASYPSRGYAMADRDTIEGLVSDYRAALTAFVNEVNKTRAVFERVKGVPVSQIVLAELLTQRIAENAAYTRYHELRSALFELAQNGRGGR